MRAAVERVQTIAGQVASATASDAAPLVEFSAIREHLAGALGEAEQRGGFLTGGVTFCALKPMRSIPARVIWLLGMNDTAFPRRSQPPQFDLMRAAPKPGDRSVRDDDRYLFLEALLSARDRLFISHVGRSLVDHEKFPPSVIVSELLDYLDQSCVFPAPATKAHDWLVFEHRLHPFSRRYFEADGRLFSYSAANCAAAAGNRSSSRLEPLFLAEPLGDPEPEARKVELTGLLSFFDNPAAYFLKQRMAIRLINDENVLDDNEPMELDALARYSVRKELFDQQLARGAGGDRNAFTARAILPSGSLGSQYHWTLRRDNETFLAGVLESLGVTVRDEPQSVDLRLGAFTLAGRLDALYGGRLAFFRPARVNPKDRLRAWLQHLVFCAFQISPPQTTILAGDDETLQFPPLSANDAAGLLSKLIEFYWRGLHYPLPFFPKTSFELVKERRSELSPLQRARVIWQGNSFDDGEKELPAFRLCFGDRDPLSREFEELAVAIFGAMRVEKVPTNRGKGGNALARRGFK